MKKYILFILIFFSPFILRANAAPPMCYLSEIKIDSTGNWVIELGFHEWQNYSIDSIELVSSSGSSLIDHYTLLPGAGYPYFDSLAVITNSNLVSPISINPGGDFIKLLTYSCNPGFYMVDSVRFGNFPGSLLSCILSDESVSYVLYNQQSRFFANFCINKTPDIGITNDTSDAMGRFEGYLYDPDGQLLNEGYFYLPDAQGPLINIKPDGSFSERIFSRTYFFNSITYRHDSNSEEIIYSLVAPFEFCMRPDSSVFVELHTTGYVSAMENKKDNSINTITVSPIPFNDKVNFYFNIDKKLSVGKLNFSIFSPDGKLVENMELHQNQRKLEWAPGNNVASGILIYHLTINSKPIKSGKIIKY